MSKKPSRRRTMETLVAGVFLGVAATGAAPAMAGTTTYEYRIDHPSYGDIGTYVNAVRQSSAETEVDSELRIAVKVLGIVVYRQEASRVERWRGDKLVSFTPSGQVMAPASVHPSNPWSPAVLKTDVMMSTRTGRLIPVTVTGGEERIVTLVGHSMRLRQYEVVSKKHQFVWFDGRGCPVAFRTEEEGASVDFVLVRRS